MPGQPLIYQDDTIVASPAAAAETVVCKLKGVASRFGNAVKLSGWVNVTPDTDATAIVLRVRRGTTTGGTLVTPAQTEGVGAAAAAVALGNFSTDVVSNDAPTSVVCDGAGHSAPCIIAAPPAWMDNAGNIIAPGLYAVTVAIDRTAGPTVPGVNVRSSGPFSVSDIYSFDAIQALGQVVDEDIQALATADLPYPASWTISGTNDATAAVSASVGVVRLAATGAGGGGLITPADAILDVIDLPGQIAQASYVLTAQMTGANSPSVINGVSLTARID